MLSVSDIHTAKTVSESGSLHAAARILHKSQPAISQAIKRLEERLGFILFDRSGYRVSLTPEGKNFLQQSDSLLASEHQLREYAQVLSKGQESSVQIAVWPMLDENILIPALQHANLSYPETSISINYLESFWATDLLLDGKLEIAICPFSRTEKRFQDLEAKRIDQVTFVTVISPLLLGGYDPQLVPRGKMSQWNQIILQDTTTGKSNSFGADRGGRHWAVNDQRLMSTLINNGLGWGLMPEPAVQDQLTAGQLVELHLPELGSRIAVDLVAARVQNQPMGPVATCLWEGLTASHR